MLRYFFAFVLCAYNSVPVASEELLSPSLIKASDSCLDLKYTGLPGTQADSQRNSKAVSACTTWREYAARERPHQLPLIDALRACHLSYTNHGKAAEVGLAALERLASQYSPLARSAKFVANMCVIKSNTELGRWDGLGDLAEQASRQVALHPNAHWLIWKTSYMAGHFEQAEQHIRFLTKISSEPFYHIALAETLIRGGKYEEGIARIKGLENAIRFKLGIGLDQLHKDFKDPFGDDTSFLDYKYEPLDPPWGSSFVERAENSAKLQQLEQAHAKKLRNFLQANLAKVFEAMAYNHAGDFQAAYDILSPFLDRPSFEGPAGELLEDPDVPAVLKARIQKYVDGGGDPKSRIKVQQSGKASSQMWQERGFSLVGLQEYEAAFKLFDRRGTGFPDKRRYYQQAAIITDNIDKPYLSEFYREEQGRYPPFISFYDQPLETTLRRQLAAFMPKSLVLEGVWVEDESLNYFEQLEVTNKSRGNRLTKSSKKKKKRKKKKKAKAKYDVSDTPEIEVIGSPQSIPVFLMLPLFEAAQDIAAKRRTPYLEVLSQRSLLVNRYSWQSRGLLGTHDRNREQSFVGYAADLSLAMRQASQGEPLRHKWISVEEVNEWLTYINDVE